MSATVKGKDLIAIGFKESRLMGQALQIATEQFRGTPKKEIIRIFRKLRHYPESFLDDPVLKPLALAMIEPQAPAPESILVPKGDYATFGDEFIEDGAKAQMDLAMRLPVTVGGALMPDAHQGYGLPIGGVLAVDNAVIPYGVGVDIGCRMALSIFDIPADYLHEKRDHIKKMLSAHTKIGAGQGFDHKHRTDHEIIDRPEFKMIPMLGRLKDKAWEQLGTSGGGNHFVEFGVIEFKTNDDDLGISAGKYLALLTHSGSRGLGATIAGHYTKIAKQMTSLPKEAANLAYLGLDSAQGQEYWMAMNLAGDYASACHEVIHDKIGAAVGGNLLAKVENHHNFAWKEIVNGREAIVHRKGATPASAGVLGFIPGSMTAPGFLVRGKGEPASLSSASHGAGRRMSRTQAVKSISGSEMQKMLSDHGVTLIGGGRDEAPSAYKDIRQVMSAQKDLVHVIAEFTPKIVRMASDGSRED